MERAWMPRDLNQPDQDAELERLMNLKIMQDVQAQQAQGLPSGPMAAPPDAQLHGIAAMQRARMSPVQDPMARPSVVPHVMSPEDQQAQMMMQLQQSEKRGPRSIQDLMNILKGYQGK